MWGVITAATIASVNIEDNIRDRIDDTDATDYEFDDASLSRAVDRAAEEYARYKPHYLEKEFTVVEDEDTYELPSECVRVTSCDYRTSQVNEYDELDDYYPYVFGDWNHPALLLIRQKLQQAYDDIGRGQWGQINSVSSFKAGQYLILYPVPDNSTDTFTIRYSALHPKENENYATIPSFHIHHIEDLAVAYLLENRARKMDNLPTQYRSGQTMIMREGLSTFLRRDARYLRQGVIDALSEVIIGRG